MSLFNPEQSPKLDHVAAISRGRHASRLLEDEVLAQAHEDAERAVLRAWLEAKDMAQREEAWAKIHAIREVRKTLQMYVSEGEYSAHQTR